MELKEVLTQAFRYFVHLDESNAAIHMSPVRYSPITFRLAEQLNLVLPLDDVTDIDMLMKVLNHRGRYEEDKGR